MKMVTYYSNRLTYTVYEPEQEESEFQSACSVLVGVFVIVALLFCL